MKGMKIMKNILMCLMIFSYFVGLSGAAENKYGVVEASFNGKPATVEGISMKVGETAEIKVNVTSKIDGVILILLKEPGFTNAFEVINGPSMMGQWIGPYTTEKNWSKNFIWTVKTNGKWVDGNAPINIVVQFHKADTEGSTYDETAYFSVANPYILNGRFSGAPPAPTPSISPVSTTPSSSPRRAPGFELFLAFCALAGAGLFAAQRR